MHANILHVFLVLTTLLAQGLVCMGFIPLFQEMSMRTWSMVFSLLFMMMFGFNSASMADALEVGQTITLKAKKPKGVPLHREAKSSYWKHVPNGVKGTIHQVTQTGS